MWVWLLAAATPPVVVAPPPTDVSVTVYGGNWAVVRETREAELPAGEMFLDVKELSTMIERDSLTLTSLSHPDTFAVEEQEFLPAYHQLESLLPSWEGRRVFVCYDLPNGQVDRVSGRLASRPRQNRTQPQIWENIVIQLDSGGYLIDPKGRLELDASEDDARIETKAKFRLKNQVHGRQKLQLVYTVNGLTWFSHYILALDQDGRGGTFTGRATVKNYLGVNLRDAELAVFAGDVSRIRVQGVASEDGGGGRTMVPGRNGENYVFKLPFRVDIPYQQTKQVFFLREQRVQVEYEYGALVGQYRAGRRDAQTVTPCEVWQWILLPNTRENGLALPLPRGEFHVQRADRSGEIHFVGQTEFIDTPQGETMRCQVGRASGIEVVESLDKGFTDSGGSRSHYRIGEVRMRNNRTEPILLKIWVEASDPEDFALTPTPDYRNSSDAYYRFELAPGEERVLRYELRQHPERE